MHRPALLTLLLVTACGAPSTRQEPTYLTPPRDETQLPFAHRIEDADTWSLLAARPSTQTVARTEVVKFIIDLASGRRVWFIDTRQWDVHYDFARDYLSTAEHPVATGYEAHNRFNIEQYRRESRRFVMGSLVHYLDADLWAFEMIAGDNLSAPRVLAAFEDIRRVVYFGSDLRYRPISALHEARLAEVADRMPSVSAAEVFRGVVYQPLTMGVAFGTLRFVRGPLDPATVRPDQIVVLEQLPDGVPVNAGIISAQLQAPLGHLALLAATRDTPNMGLRGALDDPRLTALEGRLVRLEVGPQDMQIRAARPSEAEAAWAARRPAGLQTPPLDATDRQLPDVCSLGMGDTASVGAKAAQLGEACQIGGPIRTPGGFAISFHHYLSHLERAGARRGLPQMLSDDAFLADAQVRADRLAQLRAIIERAAIDPALVRAVRRRIAGFAGSPRVILRSSTNAEDLPGFTGAGLYRSVVIGAGASESEVADAIRRVWASTWLTGAYEERQWYRIAHAEVAMGVLVQPFVDGAMANGVALTANPYYAHRPGYYVNAQALGGSVTGAAGEEIPEQHLIYTYSEDIETELLSRSSRSEALLLRDEEVRELAEVLAALHEHFMPFWQGRPESPRTAVDVEFLVAGPDRDVVVLQARPFVVRYHNR